jgi:tetratricopeptide (TPR) repeat protein
MGSPQPSRGETALELVKQANALEKAGNWVQSASIWKRLVLRNPTMPSYWERMGEASKKSRDYPNAIRGFRRALDLGASYPGPTAYEVAVCYALSGDKENALLWLKKALSLGLRSLSWVQDDQQLESVRTDPRFQSLAMVADVQSMTRDQGWRYDLQFLASELKRRHYSPFRKISKEEFDEAVVKLDSRIPNLKDEEIEVEFMRLARMMGDGHTYLRPKHTLASNVRALPIQLFFFTEGLFIIRASPEHSDLVGMRVDRIGEHTPQELLQKIDPIVSQGNEMMPLMLGPELMTYPRILFGLGLIPNPDRMTMTVINTAGSTRRVTLKEEPREAEERWASARVEQGPGVPLYLKNLKSNYWFEYIAEAKLVFFQYNIVREGEEPLRLFLDRLFRFVNEHDVERFVIDLRWNTGGTRLLNQQLIHQLIRNDKINQAEKIFVIVGRHTVSAGMMLASEIERHTDAVFVGEPTGSSPNFVGQDVGIRLPYSGMQGSLSDLYWQNSSATDFRVWIAPLLYTPPSFALYSSNRDPALEAILDYRPVQGSPK